MSKDVTVCSVKKVPTMDPGRPALAIGWLNSRYSMKFRNLCMVIAALFFLGMCGQVAAQQADGGQTTQKRKAPHEGKSADEVAKELSNPAGSLSSIYTFLTYTTYKGDLPDADDQDAWGLAMQPVLPFPVGDKGRNIIFRPYIPFTFGSPIFDGGTRSFNTSDFELLDISGQLAYTGTEMKDKHNGWLWGIGANFGMPTATDDDLSSDRWTLGPTLFGGIIREWGLVGLIAQHSMRYGGSNDDAYSTSSGQYFIDISLGNGWQFATSPNFAYDWENDELTFPVGVGVAKTTHIGKMPLKVAAEVQYYVSQPDAFGPEWFFKFTFTPVINNPFVGLFD